nr:hypothetical protein [Tanacetum cinerariifolium]
MDITIDQQVALDEALVPHASRLRIGKSNFHLKSDISSKESTLRLTPFYKAFLVTADVPEIYMQEFWATATVHHHSIQFKMDNKKHIVNLEYFREMLHICPRLPAIINKCLSRKSTGYDSLRLSQAQNLWGLYHKKNVDFAYLLWEDFFYQVKHKDAKKSNEMYYPRFTKVVIHYFMSKDPSILRRNKVNWHYVRDDQMFTTIKLVLKHQNTQQFGAMLPIELTNEDIRNSEAYKEYYAVATGAASPKTKASVRKIKSSSDTTVTPPTAATGTRLSTSAKGKQPAKASKVKNEGTGIIPGVPDVPTEESDEELSWKSGDEEDDNDVDEGSDNQDDDDAQDNDDDQDDDDQDEGDDDDDQDEGNDDDQNSDEEETKDEESFDPIPKTLENSNDEGNDEENLGLNVGREEGQDEEDDEDELYRFVNINLEGRVMDVQALTTVAPLTLYAPTLTPSTIATISTVSQAPTPPTTAPSTLLQDLPNLGLLFGFDHRLKTLETNFSEFVQTNQFAGAVSSILGIVQIYMDQRMNEAVKIIKEQVKEQVKVQVSMILPKIEQTVNEQLKAKVLTRSSKSSKTSYVVAADLSKMELKKILIEKMEGNKSIHRSDEQRNLYKALVEAYESNKIILDTYGEVVTLKRRRDDDVDKNKEPSAGSDRGSKRRREGKEPELTSAPKEKAPRQLESLHKGLNLNKGLQASDADDQPIAEASQHPEWFSQQKKPPTLDCDWNKTLPATHGSIQLWISELAKQTDSHSSFKELMDTPVDFSAFLMNRLKVPQVASTQLLSPRQMQQIMGTLSGLKTWYLVQCGFKNQESARDVYSKRRIIVVTELKIVEWYSYKHLDWITVRRDDDKLYKFKEGGFKRLRIQDIEDMLLLLVQGKLTNLTVKERLALNVSLRMFTRSIVIQRRVEDLQLGVESYQKKLNLTRPDAYRSNLKCKEAYTTYSNPRVFIYQNKDKQNRLMRIDKLHKFSDGTLNDVRTALDDRLKGIRMKYLPQTIWKKSNKERETAMIQAIDKQLKTRRIMRSLERFIGGRLYEEDFRMLQQTI